MKILFFVLFITPVWVFAAGPAAPLLPFESDLKDKAGLQRGASHFMNYCACRINCWALLLLEVL